MYAYIIDCIIKQSEMVVDSNVYLSKIHTPLTACWHFIFPLSCREVCVISMQGSQINTGVQRGKVMLLFINFGLLIRMLLYQPNSTSLKGYAYYVGSWISAIVANIVVYLAKCDKGKHIANDKWLASAHNIEVYYD